MANQLARRAPKKVTLATQVKLTPTRGQLSKIARAFRKAGKEDAAQSVKNKFLSELLVAGVSVMARTSIRISKVVKGELKVEDLK